MSDLFNETNITTWQMSSWGSGLLWATTLVFSLATTAGNLLVLIAFGTDKNLQVTSNFLIVSLAISDLIIGIEGFPVLTHYVVSAERWFIGAFACKLWISVDYTLCLVSILTVLLITIDRYLSVCYTAQYRGWLTDRKMLFFIVISWLLPFLFFIIMIYGYYRHSRAFRDEVCYPPFLDDPYLNMSMYLVYYWATLAAMVVLYRGIHRVASEVQERAEAKEKQAIAMAALQRCMAQMGVSMLLAATQAETSILTTPSASQKNHSRENTVRDSGFSTTTAVLAYQPAPIVVEKQVVPSIVSESDSALEQIGGERSGDFESIDDGDSRAYSVSVPFRHLPPSSFSETSSCSSYASFASQINSEGVTRSLLDEDMFCSRSLLVRSSLEAASVQTFRTASSGETFVTADDRLTLRSKSCSFSSAVSYLEAATPLNGTKSYIVAPRPLPKSFQQSPKKQSLSSQASWPSIKPRIRVQPERSSLRYKPDSIHPPITEEHKGETLEKIVPSKITVEFISSPSGNLEDTTVTGSSKQEEDTFRPQSYTQQAVVTAQRKPNVIMATLRRLGKTPSAADHLWARTSYQSDGREGGSSSSDHTARMGSVRSPHLTERDTFASSMIAKAANAFHGGQDLISNIFSTSWLLGRKRKKSRAERRAKKAFRTITIILGAFVLFWSPYYIFATIFAFCRACIPHWLYITGYYMCYLNSTVNPFCYAMANRQFKIAFQKILHFQCVNKKPRSRAQSNVGFATKSKSFGLPGPFKGL